MSDEPCIEHHEVEPLVWAVFTGCDGEDPSLQAIFLREQDARDYCAAKHPDPAEDGRSLAFDAQWVPGTLGAVRILTAGNDYRLDTHAALLKAIADQS